MNQEFIQKVIQSNLSQLNSTIRSGNNYYAKCPSCKIERQKEKRGFSYNPYEKSQYGGVYVCHSCGIKGNGIGLKDFFGGKIHNDPIQTKEITKEKKEGPTKFLYPESWKFRYIVRDESGKELFRKYRFNTYRNDPKGMTITHYDYERNIEYNGLTTISGKIIPRVYYRLDKIQENTDILFLSEGERKTESFLEFWENYHNSISNYGKDYEKIKFSYISPVFGSGQLLDSYSIEVIKKRNVKRVVIFPDLDSKGIEFAKKNFKVLLEAGIEVYIFNLEKFIKIHFPAIKFQEEDQIGIDIEDFINGTKGVNSLPYKKEIKSKLIDTILNPDVQYDSKTDTYSLSFFNPKKILELQTYLFKTPDKDEIRFNTRYLNQAIDCNSIIKIAEETNNKLVCVEGPQGCGKTFTFSSIPAKGKTLILTFRRELANQLSLDYGVPNYQHLGLKGFKGEDYNNSIVIVLNSLRKISKIIDNIGDFNVIIDEIDSVILTALTSKLLKKGNIRSSIYTIINKLITSSKLTILSSSDFPHELKEYLKDINKEYKQKEGWLSIINEYLEDINYHKYSDYLSFKNEIYNKIRQDRKISISINSATDSLYQKLKRDFPEKRILLINSDRRTKEVNRILETKDFSGIDILIYNQTIFTGNSFHIPEMEDHFIYSNNNETSNHYDLNQSGKRNRLVKNIHVFIDRPIKTHETDTDKIRKFELDRDHDYTRYDSPTIKTDHLFLERACNFISLQHKSLNTLPDSFWNLIKSKCKNPIIEVDPCNETPQEKEDRKKAEKEIKKEIKESKIKEIIESEDLDPVRYNEIEMGFDYSESERIGRKKNQYIEKIGIDPDLLKYRDPKEQIPTKEKRAKKLFREVLDLPLRKIESIKYNLNLLLSPEEKILEKDRLNYSETLIDNDYDILKSRQLKEDLKIIFPNLNISGLKPFLKSIKKGISSLDISNLDKILENPEEDYKRKVSYNLKSDSELSMEELEEEKEEMDKKHIKRISIIKGKIQKLESKIEEKRIKGDKEFQERKLKGIQKLQSRLEKADRESTKKRLKSKISSLESLEIDKGYSRTLNSIKTLQNQFYELLELSESEDVKISQKGGYLFRSIIQRFGLMTDSRKIMKEGKVYRLYFLDRRRLFLILRLNFQGLLDR